MDLAEKIIAYLKQEADKEVAKRERQLQKDLNGVIRSSIARAKYKRERLRGMFK